MGDQVPVLVPDVLTGMLALTLGKAMQRLHNLHKGAQDHDWTRCSVSTLCAGAASLYEAPETQLAIVVARNARGEDDV